MSECIIIIDNQILAALVSVLDFLKFIAGISFFSFYFSVLLTVRLGQLIVIFMMLHVFCDCHESKNIQDCTKDEKATIILLPIILLNTDQFLKLFHPL